MKKYFKFTVDLAK